MPVRTLRLAVGTSAPASSVHVIYTCPSGRTAIVKDVRCYSDAGCSRAVVLASHSGAADVSFLDEPIGSKNTVSLQGFMVLEPGDQLSLYSESGTFLAWVSGAELDGVAP